MTQAPWSFVAMEYYALILNRTFLITIDDACLCGIKCRGATATPSVVGNPLHQFVISRFVVRGDLDDPRAYVDEKVLRRNSNAHFIIPLIEISSVEYDATKKWGMGPYPHDGRILIRTASRSRELIVLGRQSGADLCSLLQNAVKQATNR